MRQTFSLGLLSQFIQHFSGFLLLPVIVLYFNSEEIGLWYTLIALNGIGILLDFGVQPTIIRELAKTDIIRSVNKNNAETHLYDVHRKFSSIVFLMTTYYSFLALIMLLTSELLFMRYVTSTPGIELVRTDLEGLWSINTLAFMSTIGTLPFAAVLFGLDRPSEVYIISIINRISFLIVSLFCLQLQLGILTWSIATIVGNIVSVIVFGIFWKVNSFGGFLTKFEVNDIKNIYKIVFVSIYKMGIGALTQFLILRAPLFIVNFYLGLSVGAGLGILYQVNNAIWHVSKIPIQMNLASFTRGWVEFDASKMKSKVYNALMISVVLQIIGMILVFGLYLLFHQIILVKFGMIELEVMLAVSLLFIGESFHSNCTLILSTKNYLQYYRAYIVSSLIIVVTWFIAIGSGESLLLALCLQCVVQLSYNNWKWPVVLYKQLSGTKEC